MNTWRWYRETDGTYHRGWDEASGVIQREGRSWTWWLFNNFKVEIASGEARSLTLAQEACDNASNAYQYDEDFFVRQFADDRYKRDYEQRQRDQEIAEGRLPNC